MKRTITISGILLTVLTLTSGCYTLVRPPLSAIEADSTAIINYYHKEYTDNSIENYHFYGTGVYDGYPYNPYRWHMRYDWFSGSYYYDPYYYDYRYYNRDWYYYNNRYYWYRDGYWYYTPSPGSGSSGSGQDQKTPGRRSLSVPRSIGPSAGSPSTAPVDNEIPGVSSGSAQIPSAKPLAPSSDDAKSYSTPKSSSGGSSSSNSSGESKKESSDNRRTSKPKR
jgi:hypothetical protein